MELSKLEMILELYDGKSLAEVAGMYSYTPSAVSHMLKSVEKELGIQMFVRDRSSVTPTLEGRDIYPYLKTLIDNYREMGNESDRLSNKQSGVIRLSSFTSVVVSWLPRMINEFKEEYPSTRFEILQGNYTETEKWIREGYVDLGFTIDIDSEDIESYKIAKDKLYLIFPSGHPLEDKADFELKDIEDYPFILLREGSEQLILDYINDHGLKLNITCRVMDDYAVCAMVESGIGISIVPGLFLYSAPYAIGRRCLDDSFTRPICVSYKRKYNMSPITEAFVEHVKTWTREHRAETDAYRESGFVLPVEGLDAAGPIE